VESAFRPEHAGRILASFLLAAATRLIFKV
jgi:hypothetical protein